MRHAELQLSSVVLLLTMLAFLGPGRALAQNATSAIVLGSVTRAGLNSAQTPTTQTLLASEEAGSPSKSDSSASILWTTSIVLDVLLLMAAIAFGLVAIVPTIWPPTYGRARLLAVSVQPTQIHN